MQTRTRAVVLSACVLLVAACSRPSSQPSSSSSAEDAKIEGMLRRFASAIVSKDYASAYKEVATDARSSITPQELKESFDDYQQGIGKISTRIRVETFDRESAQLLVPENLLGRIVAEGVVDFEPASGDHEGFSAQLWVLNEGGEPRIAHFFVGD